MKGNVYILTNKNNEIIGSYQVGEKMDEDLPAYMLYPILKMDNYPICNFIKENPYQTNTNSFQYSYQFTDMINNTYY